MGNGSNPAESILKWTLTPEFSMRLHNGRIRGGAEPGADRQKQREAGWRSGNSSRLCEASGTGQAPWSTSAAPMRGNSRSKVSR